MTKIKAINILLGILSVVLLFHVLILTSIIPYTVVWAGKLKSRQEMYVFEVVSVLINVLLILVLLVKRKNLNENTTNKWIDGILWLFVFLFALNTIGNLFSKSMAELIGGSLFTLISSYLCYYIVRKTV